MEHFLVDQAIQLAGFPRSGIRASKTCFSEHLERAFLRVRRICSTGEGCEKSSREVMQRFCARGYNMDEVYKVRLQIGRLDRRSLLHPVPPREQKDIVRLKRFHGAGYRSKIPEPPRGLVVPGLSAITQTPQPITRFAGSESPEATCPCGPAGVLEATIVEVSSTELPGLPVHVPRQGGGGRGRSRVEA